MTSKLGLTMKEAVALADRIQAAQPNFLLWIVVDEDDRTFGVAVRNTTEEERKQTVVRCPIPSAVFYTLTKANYG